MPFVRGLKCKECGWTCRADRSYICEECFGPLEVELDYTAIGLRVCREEVSRRPYNVWRYRELLPIEGEPRTGLESGWTPLVRANRLERHLGISELYIKDDSQNRPSLSYKDRVVSVALTRALELGFDTVACASTGNLATSLAAHAARAGVPCYVFVPSDIESGKILGSLVYGAHLVPVNGNYDDVNRLCIEVSQRLGWGFINVNLRPYYTEGAKTLGYEVAEQLGWRLPQHIVLPTAGGTLLPKVAKGFQELRMLGWVDTPLPRFYSAQAAGCSPVINALHSGSIELRPVKPKTLAKSIAIGDPADGPYVLRTISETGGWGESAEDGEILEAIRLLAEMEGVFAEPAGGATLAAALKLIRQGRIPRNESVVVAITGNGYKTPEAFDGRLEIPPAIGARFDQFADHHQKEFQLVV